ncbi:MAG: hypothetical protein US96_C0012G0007 [Candidatus Woesebacteria bacterium GW2011_GWB1_38_5b]|uniref:DUF86 domain-containing protein n=1 Tax=Candidatus Woesebacteria bacterium GW2011_GWB1_38_5b TaxID=1618569 RepID=A0A0G0K6Q4_9BACT|nr:MAG: hypothetical protein US96_C0012G0007 [Candidatus Woesebacteria bacterium GW2011_GWB1_38_5b]
MGKLKLFTKMTEERKDDILYLNHVIKACEEIASFIKSINKEQFLHDSLIQNAVLHQLSILGEALNNTSNQFKTNHSEIPWREIVGMRNIVIHDYDRVNVEVVWNTVSRDIPQLKLQIKEILNNI